MSVEIKTKFDAIVANLLSSADNTTDTQLVSGGLACVQVPPEFVEIQMLFFALAAILLPSTEEAMVVQLLLGALVWIQVWARLEFAPHPAATISSTMFMAFI